MGIFWAAALMVVILVVNPAIAQDGGLFGTLITLRACQKITDNDVRLKCYDAALSDKPKSPNAASAEKVTHQWSIEESRSKLDDSPEVVATLKTQNERGALLIRCVENKTDAIVMFDTFTFVLDDTAKVTARIDDAKPVETTWRIATNGRGVFAPSPIQFLKLLKQNGTLFIRVTLARGSQTDYFFELGNIESAKEKVARACKWG